MFSLVEKLALTGAFLGLVALAVGTDEDPGLVAEQARILAAKDRSSEGDPAPAPASTESSAPDAAIPMPPAEDVNEGASLPPPDVSAQSPVPQGSPAPTSPPDDEATQLDMRKVIAGK